MSGGVDSAVAALLLKRRGFDVYGVFIHSYNLDGCEERDSEDARRVAGKIGIPFFVWDFKDEYRARVVSYLLEGYRSGITPNPDVMCNKEIKFGLFLKKALELGADYVATGHYVRLRQGLFSKFRLEQAKDPHKDQSYFLWTLTQEQLAHCLFPVGDHLKTQVRAIAERAGLHVARKKDSQGICFLGKVTLEEFLSRHIRPERGLVKNEAGEVIGKHRGAYFYTIGQRRGIGVPGARPYYVTEKDVRTNTLVVAQGRDHESLLKKTVTFSDANWISGNAPLAGMRVFARVRYRQPLAPARLVDGRTLVFDTPQRFIAPGQSAVCYAGHGTMIGGGVIEGAE